PRGSPERADHRPRLRGRDVPPKRGHDARAFPRRGSRPVLHETQAAGTARTVLSGRRDRARRSDPAASAAAADRAQAALGVVPTRRPAAVALLAALRRSPRRCLSSPSWTYTGTAAASPY